jgi:DNA polymerase beta
MLGFWTKARSSQAVSLSPLHHFGKKLRTVGERKLLALTRLNPTSVHRQIDIRLCPLESLPYMLLGNSGDDLLMKIVRNKAMSKGWLLNEYGMGVREEMPGNNTRQSLFVSHVSVADLVARIKEGTEVTVKNEEEIFEKLGLPYLKVCYPYWQ